MAGLEKHGGLCIYDYKSLINLQVEEYQILEKTLIEEASTELLELFDQLSDEARTEKSAVPPTNEMLFWWTRKPLIVGRAIALTGTLNNIEAVKALLGLKREKRAYTYIPDATLYRGKIGKDPSQIKILDPFGGAGNLIFEAKRLGLDCSISDYNPIAYLLEKAILEYPSEYGIRLAEDFEKYAMAVIEKTREELNSFYSKNDLVYLWVWCIQCPHCSQRLPLTNHMWIANTNKNQVGIRFTLTSDKNFKTELVRKIKPSEAKEFTQKGGAAICINCRNGINYETMTQDIAKRKDREMIAKQITEGKIRTYVLATDQDKRLFEKASKYLKSKQNQFEFEQLLPDEDILPSHRKEHSLWHYGIRNWRDFFGDRQLLVMVTMVKNIQSILNEIKDKKYRAILKVYLGFIICKHINTNSIGVPWDAPRETPSTVLSLRQPRIMYNHAEINPFQKVRGSFPNTMSNIKSAISFCAASPDNIPNISLESVLKLTSSQEKYDIIITDPPYLDDVQYGELSEFFYVWVSRVLKDDFPELPSRVKLDEDICESWGRFGDKKLAKDFFQKGFKKSFVSMKHVLKDDGLLIVFFAHSDIQAWNLLLECIRESKLYVVSSYAIHTENESSVIAHGKTSFMSSIVVVCRKLLQDSVVYFEDILPIVQDKIEEMLNKISTQKLLFIPITDLLIMVYGKVLEATTNHTELKSYEKDFKPDFESLISNSRDFILRHIVTKLTGRSINLLGSQMSFYLLAKIFYRGILAGDDLLKVTRTYGLEKDRIEKDHLGTNENGHIRLYYLHERKLEKKPEDIDNRNSHEQLCYLAQIVDNKGAAKLTPALASPNFRIDDLKQIVSILLKSFRLRINKKEQLIPEEQKELKILETLADTMGIKSEGTLDSFV